MVLDHGLKSTDIHLTLVSTEVLDELFNDLSTRTSLLIFTFSKNKYSNKSKVGSHLTLKLSCFNPDIDSLVSIKQYQKSHWGSFNFDQMFLNFHTLKRIR